MTLATFYAHIQHSLTGTYKDTGVRNPGQFRKVVIESFKFVDLILQRALHILSLVPLGGGSHCTVSRDPKPYLHEFTG
jgi:hypothetical protein